ncbi:hypothetical protein OJ253_1086 [Cryptosporidium canis]|uniref:Uncharacterized protein n=1 Tax=Cryptosporidium canis TaxID=195482 RepID=A0A9D5DIB5_9CRYT|nr:hypothetical protein OJ253_1086 [Cryptosporidium canis]
MEEIIGLIFNNSNKCNLDMLLSCMSRYLNGDRHGIKLLEKKMLVDYETLFSTSEKIETYGICYGYENGLDILKTENKKRVVSKYQRIYLKSVTQFFSMKDNNTLKLVLGNKNSFFLLLKLLILLIYDGTEIILSLEEEFGNFVQEISSFVDALTNMKEGNIEIEGNSGIVPTESYILDSSAIISKLIELATAICLSFQDINTDVIQVILGFFQSIKKTADKHPDGIRLEILKVVTESCVYIHYKLAEKMSIDNLDLNISLIIALAEEIIRFEDDYSVLLSEILIANILFSIDNLLYNLHLVNIQNNGEFVIEECNYIRIGMAIKFLHLTLKLIVSSKKVLEQLISKGLLTDVIEYVILSRTLGVESCKKQFEGRIKYRKITLECCPIGRESIFDDNNGCYTKIMISSEGYSIDILQKLFVTLPLLFSTSKGSIFKVVKHANKILYTQDKDYDLSYFSLLFPVLCETCCTMHADKSAQLLLISEILELFHTAADIMECSFKKSGDDLSTYLRQNIELLSIIHITSFTYLLLLDIHFLANKSSTKLDYHEHLHEYSYRAGKFLSAFLIWCSKYEEHYILYYSAYCITSNIKGVLDARLFNNDSWVVDSVKYLFFIMTQYCLSIGKGIEFNYLESYRDGEASIEDKGELLLGFLKCSVLSNQQIYCFICASNLIDALSDIQEDIVISYFHSKIKEFNQLLSSIIEEVSENKKIQYGHFLSFSQIKNIFMFLPYKFLAKMRQSIDLIFKNIFILVSNFDIDNKSIYNTPCINIEVFLFNSVSSLYFILTIKSIFHYNMSQVEDQFCNGEDEENISGNEKCFTFKIFSHYFEKIDIYFSKLLEFYGNKKIYFSQYKESVSMLIIILEYMASIESKLNFSDKKVQKYLKLFNKNTSTNFYGRKNLDDKFSSILGGRNFDVPYDDILTFIRFGVLNNDQ